MSKEDTLKKYYQETEERINNLLSDSPRIALTLDGVARRDLVDVTGDHLEVELQINNGDFIIKNAYVVNYISIDDSYETIREIPYDINALDKEVIARELKYYRQTIVPILQDNLFHIKKLIDLIRNCISIKLMDVVYYINREGYIFKDFQYGQDIVDDQISHGEILYSFNSEVVIVKKIESSKFINDLFILINAFSENDLLLDNDMLCDCLIAILLPESRNHRRINYSNISLIGVEETFTTEECLAMYENDDGRIEELGNYVDSQLGKCHPFVVSSLESLEKLLEELKTLKKKLLSDKENLENGKKKISTKRKDFFEFFHHNRAIETDPKSEILVNIKIIDDDINKIANKIEQKKKQNEIFNLINNNQEALMARRLISFRKMLDRVYSKKDSHQIIKR